MLMGIGEMSNIRKLIRKHRIPLLYVACKVIIILLISPFFFSILKLNFGIKLFLIYVSQRSAVVCEYEYDDEMTRDVKM